MARPTVPPNAAITTPVIDGPIMRPACQGIEPSATAFGSCARGMSCGTSDMRLGSSKARNTQLSAASVSRCATPTRPEAVSANATVSVSVIITCVAITRRRRLTRSASTPPKSWKTINGTPCASPR